MPTGKQDEAIRLSHTQQNVSSSSYSLLLKGIENIKDYAIFLLDPEGKVVTWNKGAEHLKGYRAEEIIGKSLTQFYPSEAIEKQYPAYELAQAKEKGRFEDEGWRIRKDGSQFWANVIITAIFNEQKEHLGFTKITRDLTERRLAEEKLLTLQRGVDSIKDYAIFLLDPQGKVVTWNQGAQYLKGYTAEEIIGKSLTQFYPLEAIEKQYPAYELAQAKEKGHFEDEGWRVRKDGSQFWANVIITPIFNEQGGHLGFTKVTRDLTERKQAELALAQSERNYRMLASTAPVGIFHSDTQGHLLYVNERACEMMGLSEEDALGNGWLKAIHVEDKPRVVSEWVQALHTKLDFKSEFRFQHAGGQVVWVLGYGRPEIDPHNHIKSYVQTITDISERKMLEIKERERLAAVEKAETEQRRRAQEAEEHRQKLTAYIDMVCHGIRNPLTGIIGNNEFLRADIAAIDAILRQYKQQIPNATCEALQSRLIDMHNYVNSITECTGHQKIITDDVLNLSRLEANQEELNKVVFKLKALINSAANMFKAQLVKKNLKLKLILPQEEIYLKTDSHRLTQILTNLLSNAIKFTQRGQIIITARVQESSTGSYLYMSVEDEGIGISQTELTRIFHPFTQANKRITYQYGGSGLGLFISKKLVELLGGNITATSEVGKGACFTFTVRFDLPTEQEKAACENDKDETIVEEIAPKPRNIRILVVEDNLINQRVLTRLLGHYGYQYETASNGLEALNKYFKEKFDLIFMDIEMPEMNGLESTRNIRIYEQQAETNKIPIIGLSGNARVEQIDEAIEAGMDDYIVKPYTKEQLHAKIQEALESRQHSPAAINMSLSPSYESSQAAATMFFSTPSTAHNPVAGIVKGSKAKRSRLNPSSTSDDEI